MNFLVNDLSIHGQFHNLVEFVESIKRIMVIRQTVQQFDCKLYCDPNISIWNVSPRMSMVQAVQKLDINRKRAVLSWMREEGPFRHHDSYHDVIGDFKCNGTIVTGTAVGEAAYRCDLGDDTHLVSFIPSKWDDKPSVQVCWSISDAEKKEINVCNHWNKESMATVLESAAPPVTTWRQLGASVAVMFENLKFSDDCFQSLDGHPFSHVATKQIKKRLKVLDQYQSGIGVRGQRSSESKDLYRAHFTGDRSWFSDSSDTEKRKYRKELTFPHPDQPGKTLFCTWHGRFSYQNIPIRIHFFWSDRAGTPLYVTYVGPKITRK